jgi:hypothetical protein
MALEPQLDPRLRQDAAVFVGPATDEALGGLDLAPSPAPLAPLTVAHSSAWRVVGETSSGIVIRP